MSGPEVSIIIPCFNKVDYTLRCLESLSEHTPDGRYEVVLVDNASSDATPELCAALDGDVVVIRNEVNLGFSKACNQGAAAASGRYLLFLNNDTEALPGWFEPLVQILDDESDVGAVGSKLLFPDGTLQHAGVHTVEYEGQEAVGASHAHYQAPANLPDANVRRDLDVVTGACVLFRRDAFEAAGGFDEGYWNGYEDVDLCLAVRDAGWRIVYEPASVLYHHESVSGPERFRKVDANVARLQERWVGRHHPPLLRTRSMVLRTHPDRIRIEVAITGPADADRHLLERTVLAAKRATRPTDTIVLDPVLGADPTLEDERTRIGIPDPTVHYRLDLRVGVVLGRDALDHLLAITIEPSVVEAGPVLASGRGAQGAEAWLDVVPPSDRGRAEALADATNRMAPIDRLDPRCVLRNLHPPVGRGPLRRVVVGRAYVEMPQPVGARP